MCNNATIKTYLTKKRITLHNNVLDDNHRQIQWFINLMLVVGGDCASTKRYVGLKRRCM